MQLMRSKKNYAHFLYMYVGVYSVLNVGRHVRCIRVCVCLLVCTPTRALPIYKEGRGPFTSLDYPVNFIFYFVKKQMTMETLA